MSRQHSVDLKKGACEAIDIKVEKDNVIPIYHQLVQQIKQKIENGEYKPGDVLPSEMKLCDALSVSRMTVKQAMDILANEGVIYRKKGIGTFISETKIDQTLSKLTNFSLDMTSKGMVPGSRTLHVEVCAPTRELAEIFGFTGNEKILYLERLRLANALPMALEHAFLRYDMCAAIERYDLNNRSLYEALYELCGIRMVRARQEIELGACSLEESRVLGVSVGFPVFSLQRKTYDERDVLVEYTESKYRSDRYKFIIEMT